MAGGPPRWQPCQRIRPGLPNRPGKGGFLWLGLPSIHLPRPHPPLGLTGQRGDFYRPPF